MHPRVLVLLLSAAPCICSTSWTPIDIAVPVRRAFSTTTCTPESASSSSEASNRPTPSIELHSPSHTLQKQPLPSSSDTAQSLPSSSTLGAPPRFPSLPTSVDTHSALALLRSQPSHYIIASLFKSRYLLTPRDVLTVPRLKGVAVGDVIAFDKIHEVGSRDYTLRASEGQTLAGATLPPANDGQTSQKAVGLVSCRATVVEHTKGQMEETVKFKRRKRYTKTIRNKSKYTRLRIGDIVIGEQ